MPLYDGRVSGRTVCPFRRGVASSEAEMSYLSEGGSLPSNGAEMSFLPEGGSLPSSEAEKVCPLEG